MPKDHTMAPVRASTRVSIAWSDAPPDEDTDTLVLTIDGYSLDLRVFTRGPARGRIDWASVGVVTEVPSNDGTLSLSWEHLIDSRGSAPEDAGRFSILPNGDVLESGAMYNPKTGQSEAFEEVWRRLPREAGWAYAVLERVGGGAFLGRIGPRVLGLAQDGDTFRAFRDDGGERVYDFNPDAGVLPTLPDGTYTKGQTVFIGGGEWIVRAAGVLEP